EVHAPDELTLDDGAVPLGVVGGQADVLVEQEAAGAGEGDPARLVAADELVVDGQRARPGGKPEDGVGPVGEQLLDSVGDERADLLGAALDDDLHLTPSLRTRSWHGGPHRRAQRNEQAGP